ncbi:kinase-like domain-containing protein [Lophiotrema nucula]|uniref:Kinase-like domain-containing protein n=1 Tax=Lophiotrema nucula TaxID=690887 RepID=A0A6A5YF66_9PLEO|nr:kinase-like domain-containing protein [Lophiotrema nucula]
MSATEAALLPIHNSVDTGGRSPEAKLPENALSLSPTDDEDSNLDFEDLIVSGAHEQTNLFFEAFLEMNETSATKDDYVVWRSDIPRADYNPSTSSDDHPVAARNDFVRKREHDEFTELITTTTETYNTRENTLTSNIFREPGIPSSHRRESVRGSISKGQTPSFSPLSNFESPASFVSAYTPASYLSADTPASYTTARSSLNSPMFPLLEQASALVDFVQGESLDHVAKKRRQHPLYTEYQKVLAEQGLIPTTENEVNWSGKGQHVEYATDEEVPLKVLSHLGASISATVDKVLCRRIALAKKTMRCTRTWNITEALREVKHLHKLRHAHIVQLVGSFLQGRNFSILMYPAADFHLGTFLEDTSDMRAQAFQPELDVELTQRDHFLNDAFACLSNAIAHVHAQTTKHMDIKPANILVRRDNAPDLLPTWRIYLADFGLSRSFADQDHSQTDGPIARTPKYCAPEVYEYESRGRSADIFSLGCVFLEILTVLCASSVQEFADFRSEGSGDESFRANLKKTREWVEVQLRKNRPPGLSEFMLRMVSLAPAKRPAAADLDAFFNSQDRFYLFGYSSVGCDHTGPERYEAHRKIWSYIY